MRAQRCNKWSVTIFCSHACLSFSSRSPFQLVPFSLYIDSDKCEEIINHNEATSVSLIFSNGSIMLKCVRDCREIDRVLVVLWVMVFFVPINNVKDLMTVFFLGDTPNVWFMDLYSLHKSKGSYLNYIQNHPWRWKNLSVKNFAAIWVNTSRTMY